MDKIWVIIIGIAVFSVLAFLFYQSMRGYVRTNYGKKWLKLWGNKLYFWQSLIFMSLAGTVLIMFLLNWGNVLSF